ncbi:hypothetical protein [Brevibacillus sp. SYSU BS000544]|uniref:hypothetical protein n=1 Tax=Brevibacillus sp. SYSU BS000544 TaxID=3416443 RepID=UPI003CE5B55B
MLNRLIPKSPLGIALTAASVLFAVSPEARKLTRRAAVKGIAGVLSLVDQLKEMTSSTTEQINGLIVEAKGMDQLEPPKTISFSYDTGMKPVEFRGDNQTQDHLQDLH